MDFNEFKILVKGMKALYTSERFLPDDDSIKIWFNMLKDLDYQVANAAIMKYALTNKFPPTVADIRQLSASVSFGNLPDWGEGWKKTCNAIRAYGYYKEKEALNSLDELTRETVERMGYKQLCLSENADHDRANFRMIYERLAERKQQERQMPGKLALTIEGIRQRVAAEQQDVKQIGGSI